MNYSVAIYVRLSNEDRNKQNRFDESESIQNQKSMLATYCQERNWNIYDIYCDEDYSGTDNNRPEFKRMIEACKSGNVNLVLCKSQSRFSRDAVVIETYLHDKFIEWGVRFKSIVDHVDTDDKSNKKSRQVNAMVNEWYVEETSENIRRILQHKREQGQFTGSFAPYGYAIDPKNKNHLIIDDEAAPIVRMIFDLYNKGYSYRKILVELNERGIPNPTLYKEMHNSKFYNHNAKDSTNKGLWTQPTISTMLRNETYTGTLVQGKSHSVSYKNKKRKKVSPDDWIRFPDAHEAIIDKEVWQNIQCRFKSHTRVNRTTSELSPLAEKVKCAVCGRPMKRNVYYNKTRTKQYYNLQCASYKIGAMNCNNTKSMSGLQLEEFLVKQINTHIRKYCNTHKLTLIDKHQEKIDSLQKTIDGFQEQISDKENKVTKTYEDYLDTKISFEQYEMISKRFTADIAEMKNKCSKLQEQIDKIANSKIKEENCKAIIEKYSFVEKLTREIAEDFIEQIYIGEIQANNKREITIDWKF